MTSLKMLEVACLIMEALLRELSYGIEVSHAELSNNVIDESDNLRGVEKRSK